VDLAPPPSDSAPVLGPQPEQPPSVVTTPAPVIGGVAALLAARLGVDALWIRIAFVLTALVGGLGVLVYGALWLLFIVGASKQWARITGGVLLVAGLPLILTGGFDFFDGPFAVLALLAGLAIALWQPRAATAPARWTPPPPVVLPPEGASSEAPPRWVPRPPSILGRLTLGIAVLVAAGGALIDQANGGRLHPEQWLGAAAIVCGVGLAVGAFAGRALWLVLPAVAFAGSGFVAGEAARIGIDPTTLFGDATIHVLGGEGGWSQREHVVAGRVEVNVERAPRSPVTIDARVAFGEIDIRAARDVTVEIRAEADNGTIDVDGARRGDGTFTIGPEGEPDVVVDAIIAHGDIEVDHVTRILQPIEPLEPIEPIPPVGPGGLTIVADGVAISSSGNIVLADGEAVVRIDGAVLTGDFTQRDRVTVISTSMGEFQFLPGGLLVTPDGDVLDLRALTTGG
jgi:phage shock protein PspC (stress-responsive transcriptional regulator)